MRHRAIFWSVLLVVLAAAVLATAARPPEKKKSPRPEPPDGFRQEERQMIELMTNPIRSGLYAVHRIKELGAKHGKVEAAAEALELVAREADEPPVRVAALFMLSELREARGDIPGAMEALAMICMPPERPRGPGREPPEAHERFREMMQKRMREMMHGRMRELPGRAGEFTERMRRGRPPRGRRG